MTKLADSLAIAFFVLMGLAFLATVFGSPGTGLLLLILGSCAHVARVWLEGLSGSPASPRSDVRAPGKSNIRRP